MKIPEHEQENVLSTFWAALLDLESKTDPKDVLGKLVVDSGYEVLNRIGYTKARASWDKD